MVLIVAIVAIGAAALALVVNNLRKAPVGYEDESGFHIVRQVKGSAVLRYPRPEDVAAGALKGARAHS